MVCKVINQIGSGSTNPLSLSRAERSERVDNALDSTSVAMNQLSPEQMAANRQYGVKLVDDIASAQFLQPPTGVSSADFQTLAARLGG